MDPGNSPDNTEAELESFRQKWRDEVTARTKGKAPVPSTPAKVAASSSKPRYKVPDVAPHTHAWHRSIEHVDQATPHVYQRLGDKQHGRRLDETSTETAAALAASLEPSSALEHYEKAVEKEVQGSLGDSVSLYRKAFRLDSEVHETYKAKHFPPSYFKGRPPAPTPTPATATATVPTRATPGPVSTVSAIPEVSTATTTPQDHVTSTTPATPANAARHSIHGFSPSIQLLLNEFASLTIQGESPPTDLSPPPPCPISGVPEEILVEIIEHLAVRDVAAFARLAQVCKRFAFLVLTEDRVWKRVAFGHEYGFAAMHYTWSCQVDGTPLGDDEQGGFTIGSIAFNSSSAEGVDSTPSLSSPISLVSLLVPTPYPTHRLLFQRRPRVRFNGCYISTVNYMRPGQSSPTSLTWNSPIHIVTYYRYLRFLRDGTCISLLTTSEPVDVVPHLYVDNMHKNHGSLPTAPIKDALLGRWRLTGPDIPGSEDFLEKEGTLIVETAGATPKYMYKMALGLGNAGRGTKNNKLSWHGYWSYNRLTDDWGEFGLKNDRAFYWSRVKSFGLSWDGGGMK